MRGQAPIRRNVRFDIAARYPRLHARKHVKIGQVFDPTGIVIGMSPMGVPMVLPERPRREHLHAIGATGAGKTNFLANSIRQDIEHGWGVCAVERPRGFG